MLLLASAARGACSGRVTGPFAGAPPPQKRSRAADQPAGWRAAAVLRQFRVRWSLVIARLACSPVFFVVRPVVALRSRSAAVRSMAQVPGPEKGTVLVVDDDVSCSFRCHLVGCVCGRPRGVGRTGTVWRDARAGLDSCLGRCSLVCAQSFARRSLSTACCNAGLLRPATMCWLLPLLQRARSASFRGCCALPLLTRRTGWQLLQDPRNTVSLVITGSAAASSLVWRSFSVWRLRRQMPTCPASTTGSGCLIGL